MHYIRLRTVYEATFFSLPSRLQDLRRNGRRDIRLLLCDMISEQVDAYAAVPAVLTIGS